MLDRIGEAEVRKTHIVHVRFLMRRTSRLASWTRGGSAFRSTPGAAGEACFFSCSREMAPQNGGASRNRETMYSGQMACGYRFVKQFSFLSANPLSPALRIPRELLAGKLSFRPLVPTSKSLLKSRPDSLLGTFSHVSLKPILVAPQCLLLIEKLGHEGHLLFIGL